MSGPPTCGLERTVPRSLSYIGVVSVATRMTKTTLFLLLLSATSLGGEPELDGIAARVNRDVITFSQLRAQTRPHEPSLCIVGVNDSMTSDTLSYPEDAAQ